MARIKAKPSDDAPAPKTRAKPKAKAPKAAPPADEPSRSRHPLARRRVLAGTVLAVVALLTLGGRALWELVGPKVMGRERYLLQADNVVVTDLPEWIVADVRSEALSNSGLAGHLSILDGSFMPKLQSAFALHPWIASVDRIEKRPPSGARVEVTYRRPVAAIEAPLGNTSQLLPIDANGILLPAEDVPLIRRSYLPRISGVGGQPPAGQKWDDPRVAGAIDLAERISADWDALSLVEISPSARPEVRDERKFFVYDMVTRGGTRIVWGASPRESVPGEDDFIAKLGRLKRCIDQYASLDWTDWPAVIDIRHDTTITPRTAKKPKSPTEPAVAEKTEPTDAEPVVK